MADKPSTKKSPTKPETKPASQIEAQTDATTKPEEKPEPEKPKTTTQPDILEIVQSLTKQVEEHIQQIAELKGALARKRKPTRNGKISIKDTKTGKVYPSKNNVYKSLLASGELADLVKQGVFGDDPEHNNFGAYALFKAFPGRFEEVKEEKEQPQAQAQS